MNNQISAYMSHSIRGKYREKATHEQMQANCERALKAAEIIRKAFPALDLYVPAENEEPIQLASDLKYLSEQQILDIDCAILAKRNILIVYAPDSFISNGMWVEIVHAHTNNIPVVLIQDKNYFDSLNAVIESFLR